MDIQDSLWIMKIRSIAEQLRGPGVTENFVGLLLTISGDILAGNRDGVEWAKGKELESAILLKMLCVEYWLQRAGITGQAEKHLGSVVALIDQRGNDNPELVGWRILARIMQSFCPLLEIEKYLGRAGGVGEDWVAHQSRLNSKARATLDAAKNEFYDKGASDVKLNKQIRLGLSTAEIFIARYGTAPFVPTHELFLLIHEHEKKFGDDDLQVPLPQMERIPECMAGVLRQRPET